MPESLYRKKLWLVRHALFPRDDDQQFPDEASALAEAAAMAKHQGSAYPVAVWSPEDELVHLFFCGEQFRRV